MEPNRQTGLLKLLIKIEAAIDEAESLSAITPEQLQTTADCLADLRRTRDIVKAKLKQSPSAHPSP